MSVCLYTMNHMMTFSGTFDLYVTNKVLMFCKVKHTMQ